jgi:putative membrane protein
MIRLRPILIAGCLLAVPAAAQNNAGSTGGTAVSPSAGNPLPSAQSDPRQGAPSQVDRSFVLQAIELGTAQARVGRKVAEKAKQPAVRDLARDTAEQQARVVRDLDAFAQQYGLAQPTALKPEQEQMLSRIEKAEGGYLERMYLDSATDALQKTASVYQDQAERGANPPLRKLAADNLPVVHRQLETARKLAGAETGK